VPEYEIAQALCFVSLLACFEDWNENHECNGDEVENVDEGTIPQHVHLKVSTLHEGWMWARLQFKVEPSRDEVCLKQIKSIQLSILVIEPGCVSW
jgi:hypothetical protein